MTLLPNSRFVLLTAVLVALGASPAVAAWTAQDAVATALRNSPDAAIARARVTAADSLLQQARANALPQLSLAGRYTQTNSPMPAFGAILSQRAFSNDLDFNRPGRIDHFNATATVGYPVYSGGRTRAGRNAAAAGAEAAAADLRAAQHELAARAIKALLELRKARAAVGAVEAGVRAYEAALENSRLRFAAGQVLKADLLSLEVQLAQTRESLTVARHGAALAERTFLFVLGLEPTADVAVELAPNDPGLAGLEAPAEKTSAQRPELRALERRLRAAEHAVDMARGERRPHVNAFASYQYDQGWKLDRHADSWLAGVAVDVKVFDGGRTSARIRQAEAELAEVRETLRRAEQGFSLEAEQARLAYAAARERLEVSAQTVLQAEESAALNRARFEEGALLAADLIGAETRLLEARLRRTFAEADERIAVAELHRALGLPAFTTP